MLFACPTASLCQCKCIPELLMAGEKTDRFPTILLFFPLALNFNERQCHTKSSLRSSRYLLFKDLIAQPWSNSFLKKNYARFRQSHPEEGRRKRILRTLRSNWPDGSYPIDNSTVDINLEVLYFHFLLQNCHYNISFF